MKRYGSIVFLCLFCSLYYGQDIHWSQPGNALLYLNPAFAGIDGKYNVGINYKDQWRVAGKPYKTYMAAGDVRLNSDGNVQFGLGALASNDVTSDGRYKTVQAGLNLSCLIKVGKQSRFGVGFGINYMQKSLSDDTFSWGNQFDGNNYDPSLSSGEANGGISRGFADLNAGISYSFDKEQTAGVSSFNQHKWIAGYTISHITQPNISFAGKDKLYMKHTGFVKGLAPIGEKFWIVPTALVSLQGPMLEVVAGALLRRTIGQTSKVTGIKKGAAVSLGMLYRYKNSLIPTLEIEKANYIFALCYDITISGFSTASKRGGLEFSLRIRSNKSSPKQAAKKHGRPKHGGKWF